MENKIYEKCRLLGLYSPIFVCKMTEFSLSLEDELYEQIPMFREAFEGLQLISSSLDLDCAPVNMKEDNFDSLRPITSLVYCCLMDVKVSDKLKELYDPIAELNYSLLLWTNMALIISDCLNKFSNPEDIKILDRRKIIQEEIIAGEQYLSEYCLFLKDREKVLNIMFPGVSDITPKILSMLENNQVTRNSCGIFNSFIESLIDLLIPNYYEISFRFEKGLELIEEINHCKRGKIHWRQYEKLGIKILRFLFVPPFIKVYKQPRTEIGDSKRDAVLPNNQFSGFWNLLRHEFESKHIICEFKNYASTTGKEELNQLRLYLSKPTVGRFGLLFVRDKPKKQLLEARKRAYEEHRILILILDDETVKKMIKMRAYSGSPEEILEQLKIEFELKY